MEFCGVVCGVEEKKKKGFVSLGILTMRWKLRKRRTYKCWGRIYRANWRGDDCARGRR